MCDRKQKKTAEHISCLLVFQLQRQQKRKSSLDCTVLENQKQESNYVYMIRKTLTWVIYCID